MCQTCRSAWRPRRCSCCPPLGGHAPPWSRPWPRAAPAWARMRWACARFWIMAALACWCPRRRACPGQRLAAVAARRCPGPAAGPGRAPAGASPAAGASRCGIVTALLAAPQAPGRMTSSMAPSSLRSQLFLLAALASGRLRLLLWRGAVAGRAVLRATLGCASARSLRTLWLLRCWPAWAACRFFVAGSWHWGVGTRAASGLLGVPLPVLFLQLYPRLAPQVSSWACPLAASAWGALVAWQTWGQGWCAAGFNNAIQRGNLGSCCWQAMVLCASDDILAPFRWPRRITMGAAGARWVGPLLSHRAGLAGALVLISGAAGYRRQVRPRLLGVLAVSLVLVAALCRAGAHPRLNARVAAVGDRGRQLSATRRWREHRWATGWIGTGWPRS